MIGISARECNGVMAGSQGADFDEIRRGWADRWTNYNVILVYGGGIRNI